jgi:hypothetical protein
MIDSILNILVETLREYSFGKVIGKFSKAEARDVEKNESEKVVGKFIQVESVKAPALMIAAYAGFLLMGPAMFVDAYLVHRFPTYFPHFLDFTMIFEAVYFAVLFLRLDLRKGTKNATERTIALILPWSLVLAMAAMPWYINHSAVLPECVQNLWEIQTAKVEWMVANHKMEYDTPTWDDVKPYLQKRGWKDGIPVCPDGGKYTLGKVGQRPTCSIGDADHWLPSIAEAPKAKVRY